MIKINKTMFTLFMGGVASALSRETAAFIVHVFIFVSHVTL